MVGRRPAALAGCALLLAGILVPSCTLTRESETACVKNADCRGAFGAGSVCASATGFCRRMAPHPRCTQTFPEDLLTRPESYPDIMTLGSLADRSLDTQVAREEAIVLATRQVNEQNGLDGRRFGIVFCDVAKDSRYDSLERTAAAVESATYLADVLGVPAILGPSASGDALAVFDATRNQDVLVISPAASSPELTSRDENPTDETPGLLWRTAAPDTLQGAAIARYLITTRPADVNVVVVHEKGPYGDSLASVFKTSFETGNRTVKTLAFANASERDAAVIEAAVSKPPFVLFFSSQTNDAVAFLNAAQSSESYSSVSLFLSESAANPDLLRGAAGSAPLFPRVVGSRPALPAGPTFELFKASYSAAFRKDATTISFVPHAYDAAWLVFYGTAWSLRQEKALTSRGIARGLRKVSGGGPEIPVTPANWTKVIDAFGAGNAVNLSGASGTLDFDPATEETTGLINIWKISADGKAIEGGETIDPKK